MHRLYALWRYVSDKRFSTISGTLVYFLLMSVTPFLFWLALLAGNVDLSGVTSRELFSAVSPVVEYLQKSAASATGGAGVILLLTSLWSSTNFFYHLRRSGEIIYGADKGKGGIRLRLFSLFTVVLTLIVVAAASVVPFLSKGVLSTFMPEVLADGISLLFLTAFAVLTAYLLNLFACPYKLGFSGASGGSLLTAIFWLVGAVGFSIYLRFADPSKLYGAVAAIIVFLLWCYVMINCLVLGIIYNGRYLFDRKYKKLF